MDVDQDAYLRQYQQKLEELRAEIKYTRAELENKKQKMTEATDGVSSVAGTLTADSTGSSIIAGQYNSADATTTLKCTIPTDTLSLLNRTTKTSQASPASVGLYVLTEDIGIIVSAVGNPAFPVRSRAVQAFCYRGDAILADSGEGYAIRAHTTHGDAAIIADQESTNPRSNAVLALGGYGVGLYASGATAALQLGKSSSAGPPTSGNHQAGELMLDVNADLYLCKLDGTPGTWTLIG